MISKPTLIVSVLSTVLSAVSAASNSTNSTQYPVACEGMAFGVGNVTISSLKDTSLTYQRLQPGPSQNYAGQPLLDFAPDSSVVPLLFMTCNSSYMNYKSYVFNADETNVTFYGHIVRTGAVGQLFEYECVTRTLDGSLVFTACDHTDGPSQLAQYWKMVKNETNPALPAPLEFVGQPNGTHSPFYFTPGIYSVNGTKAISEHLAFNGPGSEPAYQLTFNVY